MSIAKPTGKIRWPAVLLAAVVVAIQPAPPALAADGRVTVIVQMDAGASIPAGTAAVRRAGGRVTGRLAIVNGFAAEIPARRIERLAAIPGVRAVTRNGRMEPKSIDATELRSPYPGSVNAIDTWNAPDAGATGKGVGVAVIDTGIAAQMPDFDVAGPERRTRVVASVVTNPYARTGYDTYGHGTHVAGIVGGNGTERAARDKLRGHYVGIAPEADLISVKVSDDRGRATVLDVIYGLQFVVDHADRYGIRVVNLSLESTAPQSYKTDPLDAAVEAAWFHGLVVVAAAGNRGNSEDAVSYAPGNDPFAISVGAIDDRASRRNVDDRRPSWSSHGVTQDGFAKPEIHAPGSRIVSTLAPFSMFTTMCRSCIVEREMIRAGGTSMSAPMVSGAAALLLEKHPQLTPDEVKGVLMASARMVDEYPTVDVYAAVKAVDAGNVPVANVGIEPNGLIDPQTGDIDYSRSSWSRSSWSRSSWSGAEGAPGAGWALSSWSCDCSRDANGEVLPSLSSWSLSSWSVDWSK